MQSTIYYNQYHIKDYHCSQYDHGRCLFQIDFVSNIHSYIDASRLILDRFNTSYQEIQSIQIALIVTIPALLRARFQQQRIRNQIGYLKQYQRKQNQRIENQINNSEYIQQYQKQYQKKVWRIIEKYKKLRNQKISQKDINQLLIKQQIQIVQAVYDKAYQQSINMLSQTKNVIFIGNTSAGKSRLLNKLFNLKLKSGKGETTLKCQCVHTVNNKINIFDSVWYNQSDDNIKKYRSLIAEINCCHLVFICFQGSLKSLKRLLEIICNARNRMYKVAFIYTKCDMIDPEQNTFEECIKAERKFLVQLGIEKPNEYPIFMSSAKCDKLEGGQNENYKIINMINALQYA